MRRNENIKPAPQRFQDADLSQIDICICFDENVFDLVIEGIIEMQIGSHPRFAIPYLSRSEATPRFQHACKRSS